MSFFVQACLLYLKQFTNYNNTTEYNGINSEKRENSSSIYNGTCWDKTNNLWQCKIYVDGKQAKVGNFYLENEAGQAFNDHMTMLYGDEALLYLNNK